MAKGMVEFADEKQGYCRIRIKKGLDLKIDGAPGSVVENSPPITRVALLGDDYPMLKPAFKVGVGDTVKTGQVLFVDREQPRIQFTSPGAGTVVEINRGEKRAFESIVIELSETRGKKTPSSQEVVFSKYDAKQLKNIPQKDIIENLLQSGLWSALRSRPFGVIPAPPAENTGQPSSIFVTAVDTNPHSPPPEIFINEYRSEFETGLEMLSRLVEGRLFLVKKDTMALPLFSPEFPSNGLCGKLIHVDVSGPHPAGNVGTHIHFLDPVGSPSDPQKSVWYINYQDVAAIGYLFVTGRLFTDRLVSVSGPACEKPTLMKTRLGASVDEMVAGRKKAGDIRQVSGSLLSGNIAAGTKAFLGRYHTQVSLIEEGRQRKLLGWLDPGFNRFSSKNIYISSLLKPKSYDFTTSTNGSARAMVPIEVYEKVMPLDIQPVFLLRSILMGDIEHAEELGVLELEEEDLALCTFVSPGKDDFGYILRTMLNRIRKGE